MKCVQEWYKANVFDEYIFVLPAWGIEQNDTYAFLENWENTTIYDAYHPEISNKLLDRQIKIIKKNGRDNSPRVFMFIDDTTHQRQELMKDPHLVKICTMSRHYNIHLWIAMHATKNVIPPGVRAQMSFIFVYDIKPTQIKLVYDEYMNSHDFKRYDDFHDYWEEKIQSIPEHRCLLIDNLHNSYSSLVVNWFSN